MNKQNLIGKVVINIDYGSASCGRTYLVREYVYPDQEGSENYLDLLDIEEMLIETANIEQFDQRSEQFRYFTIEGNYKDRLIMALNGRNPDSWPEGR